MKLFVTPIILGTLFIISGCKKDSNGNPAPEPELMVDKIVGPVFWQSFPTVVGYGADSTLYTYNSNNRISHIVYFNSYQPSGGSIVRNKAESNFTYDGLGNVKKITLQGNDPYVLEKEVSFDYDPQGNVIKAKIIFRSNGGYIRENDSAVHTYAHRDTAISPLVINRHTIVDQVYVTTKFYGLETYLEEYLMGMEEGGLAYMYWLDKDHLPLQMWKTHYYSTRVHETFRYEYVDSSIVNLKVYTNDLFVQGNPSDVHTFERTSIPEVSLQISKNIFGKNFWISNIGILSPFHTMQASTFVKASNPNTNRALYFSYQVDNDNKKLVQLGRDQNGVYQPLSTYYFR